MKKLYTLLLAAAVTLSAAAASPFQAKKAAELTMDSQKLQTLVENSSSTIKPIYTKTALKALNNAVSRADEFPSLDTKYMLLSYADLEETTTADAAPCHLYEDETAGAGAGFYYLDDFIMGGTNKIECMMGYEDVTIDGQSGTVLKLVIPSNTPLYTYNGETYKLRFFGYSEDGSPSVYTNDIEFWYAQGIWIFPYEDYGIAWLNSKMSGSWIVNPTMIPTNGTYTGTEVTDVDDQGQATESEQVATEVYAEYYEENNTIVLANFGNFGKVIALTVNAQNQEAIAINQTAKDIIYKGNILYGTLNDFGKDTGFTAALKSENGKTILTNEQSWVTIAPNEILGNTNPVWYSIFVDSKITLDFEIPGLSGISNVTVADENAPVEYYNLQGVRVANPANGLYIKRQGNKATKVLVK